MTAGTYGAGGAPKVVAWSVTEDPNAPATKKDRPITPASGLPERLFYGADGMVDLPFGELSLLSYTGSGPPFRGEALFYSSGYDVVKNRAKVNGLYSGLGLPGGTLVYSGLSPISASDSTTNDNGLYGASSCDTQCGASWKIFGWKGASGPVAVDVHGNVFVAASLSGADTSDAVYGLAKSQINEGSAREPTTLATIDSGGSSTFAALAPEGGTAGWVLGLGFDPKNGAYAADFTEAGGTIAKGTKVLPGAVARGTAAEAISVFTDAEGDLWLAVVKGPSGAYLELRRKP